MLAPPRHRPVLVVRHAHTFDVSLAPPPLSARKLKQLAFKAAKKQKNKAKQRKEGAAGAQQEKLLFGGTESGAKGGSVGVGSVGGGGDGGAGGEANSLALGGGGGGGSGSEKGARLLKLNHEHHAKLRSLFSFVRAEHKSRGLKDEVGLGSGRGGLGGLGGDDVAGAGGKSGGGGEKNGGGDCHFKEDCGGGDGRGGCVQGEDRGTAEGGNVNEVALEEELKLEIEEEAFESALFCCLSRYQSVQGHGFQVCSCTKL